MTTYQEAAKQYRENPTPEVLEEQVQALVAEMSLKEKIYMLSGHTIAQTQRDLIKTSRAYNVSALPGGGCRRLAERPGGRNRAGGHGGCVHDGGRYRRGHSEGDPGAAGRRRKPLKATKRRGRQACEGASPFCRLWFGFLRRR